jgi:Cu+-exporting ATPase
MNRAGSLIQNVSSGPESILAERASDSSREHRVSAADFAACYHCGEPCPDTSFASAGKIFCCQGCLVVHDLLAGNGLEYFYQLSSHPGVRVRRAAQREQWACLDEPALQQRLLDFTDGKLSRVTLHLPAIHCVACVWLLENLFRLHAGIVSSQVNFPRREASIRFAADKIKLSELVALLTSIGYEPSLTLGELERRKTSPARQRQWMQTGIAAFAFGNIMLFSLPAYMGLDSFSGAILKTLFGYLSLALALPVLVYSASDYWKSAWLSLRQRALTLDVPIALGLAALYAQSVLDVVSGHGGVYLDSLAGLVFFLLCGRIFQQKTHDRLAFDRDYKCFFPLSVIRKTPGGEESAVISNLRVGDRLVLRNGELIPADAKLAGGRAFIDYSFVTGESEPVAKEEGDYLYAGGKQAGGAIEVEIVKPVSQSYLASLWNHEAFQKIRDDNFNTLTNRYSRRFTVIVVSVALGAALFWCVSGNPARAIKAFSSVLIVACPCALALAAPFTLGAAQRLLARTGVFLRNSLVIEKMAHVNAIAFDKTGTLTAAGGGSVSFQGEPLTAAEAGWVCSLARHSTHPHSARIAASFSATDFANTVGAFHETPGCGIGGKVDGHEIRLGSQKWMVSCGVEGAGVCSADFQSVMQGFNLPGAANHSAPGRLQIGETAGCKPAQLSQSAHLATATVAQTSKSAVSPDCRDSGAGRRVSKPANCLIPNALPTWKSAIQQVWKPALPAQSGSVVCLAIDGQFRGAFVLESELRSKVGESLHRLAARYEIALLSGDNEKERERFREFFGGDARLHFNQTPLDKLGVIRDFQASGKTVMMVGDGLNDAGALKQSDVGVAVVEQIGAFSPASDVILEASQVPHLYEILAVARNAALIVRLSFGISALYNVVGVSIAAAGILSPVICAILMPLSSISVVLFACGATNRAARNIAQFRPRQDAVPPLSKSAGEENGNPAFEHHAGLETRLPAPESRQAGNTADPEVCAAKEAAA